MKLWNEAGNRLRNEEITNKMVEHIGKIDPELGKIIEGGLKKEEPIEWLFEKEEEVEELQSQQIQGNK